MFNNKKSEFWFWFLLTITNVFIIMVADQNRDELALIIGWCMLALCFCKSLICAMEIDVNK